jgi:hypothetical protein
MSDVSENDDMDVAAAPGRGPSSDARDANRIRKRVKMCNNVCPICWMPLALDITLEMDKKWDAVSATFKAKPAFSVKHPDKSRSVARHTFAFGMNALAKGKVNYQKCHYVHVCMVGTEDSILSYWTLYTGAAVSGPIRHSISRGGEVRTLYRSLRPIVSEPPRVSEHPILPLQVLVDIERLQHSVCIEGSIFSDALSRDSQMGRFIYEGSESINHPGISDVVTLMKNKFFAGCCDCNTSMTLSVYLQPLFELIFIPSLCSSVIPLSVAQKNVKKEAFKVFSLENMVHYIMLSGMLNGRDVAIMSDNEKGFVINDVGDRDSWQLRFVLIWCALQILACLWKFSTTDKLIGHHKSYVFLAVADFYFSLLFYALHEGLRPNNDDRSFFVDFEMFNFYYSSHLPFYNIANMAQASNQVNLSLHVLHIDKQNGIRRFEEPDFKQVGTALSTVRRQMKEILDASVTFWNGSMKELSHVIHDGVHTGVWDRSDPAHNPQDAIRLYFVSPKRLRTVTSDLRNKTHVRLTVQRFANALHPYWYWFHFKYITMPRIISLCEQYDAVITGISTPGVGLWKNWVRLFNASVRALGAEAGSEDVRALLPSANSALAVEAEREGVRGNVRALLQSANALRARAI